MKWVLFTGTWRLDDKNVERDVSDVVREVLARGDGIVTGGATGVDYFAMAAALKFDPKASRLKVIIPAALPSYIYDYNTNWCLAPITKEIIADLANLLWQIKEINPSALIEMPYDVITQEHYDLRDSEEVKIANEVYAFQVNDSVGTQNTINEAVKLGLPIRLHKKYQI